MGNANALPSYEKIRGTLLLKMHHQFVDRQDALEVILMEKLQQYQETDCEIGCLRREKCFDLLAEIGIPTSYGSKISKMMDVFEDENGLVDVHDFIEYLRPPGIVKVSLEEQFDPSNVFSIHQGRLKRNGRKVLVKQVVYDDKYSGQEILHIRKIIQGLKMYQHENLIRYLGSTLEQGSLQIVQEWNEACTVETTVKAFGPMQEKTIRRYLRQALAGLSYLHFHGKLHKFLHGCSVYIDHSGIVKLAEFEVGRQVASIALKQSAGLDIYSFFPPPETAKQTIWGQKADVWCLGLVAMEMIRGTKEVARNDSGQVPTMPAFVSEELRQFLLLCFNTNPKKRASVHELLASRFMMANRDENTNQMLSEVCTGLDETMNKLKRSMPRNTRKGPPSIKKHQTPSNIKTSNTKSNRRSSRKSSTNV